MQIFRSALFVCCLLSADASRAIDKAERAAREEQEAREEAAATVEANALTPEEAAAGWKLLFDGKTVPGLRGLKNAEFLKSGWTIDNGALSLPKEPAKMGTVTGGDLITAEQFTDFEFAFQWKLAVSSNTGILYFARAGVGKPTGCEFQIIDDMHHPDGLKGGPPHRTGALFSILPPAADAVVNEPGEWNSGKIVVQGMHVEHWLNGARVLEYDVGARGFREAIAASKTRVPPGFGMTKFKTALLILDEGDEAAFRGLKVRALLPAQASTKSTP